jgi:hypothetical protein
MCIWCSSPSPICHLDASCASSRVGSLIAVLAAAPELRADLGDHLWQEGYDWVEITSHRQLLAELGYVRANRTKSGLEPIVEGYDAAHSGFEKPGHGDTN